MDASERTDESEVGGVGQSAGAAAVAGAAGDARGGAASGSADGRARGEGPWTVRALLGWIAGFLKEREVDSPRAIAEILVASVLGTERLRLYMEPDRELAPEQLTTLRGLVARAGRHEPVQFLVGRWPFLGRDFEVAPCTLIPRPCTELLVEQALAWYRARGGGSVRALDLCTGTGCIAVSLALGLRAIARPDGAGCRPIAGGSASVPNGVPEVPVIQRATDSTGSAPRVPVTERGVAEGVGADGLSIEIVATDIVADAVALARRNAARLGATGLDARTGDLFGALRADETFDLLVSNPPYVTDDEYAALDRNVREYEPASALRGGRDGLDFVRRIAAEAPRRVRPGGLILLEIGWKHREGALQLFGGAGGGGPWRGVEVLRDGEGLDRVLVAHRA